MSYNFLVKTALTFGVGAAAELPGLVEKHGLKSVFLVYDGGVKAAGIAEKVLAQLEKTDAKITIFDGVIPNPTNEVVEEAALLAKEAGVDGFVAVGGGSSIDLAKAVNVLMTNPGKIGEYGGIGMVKNDCLPLIAIPTTSGTSSEITNVSALIDTEKVIKYVVIDDKIIPSNVIADPEFTRTVPRGVTAATGMDAITHAVESYISNMATPLTKYNALEALKIFCNALPKCVADGNDMEAREQMMLGCIIAGFSFSNANLGLVHGIAHTLSAHFQLAHGDANAAVLPYVMAYNAQCCPQEMVEMAKALGIETSGDIEKDKLLLSESLLALCKEVGIRTLSQYNITKDDFSMIADDVLKEPVLNFNPRQGVTKEDVIAILDQAF